MAVTVTADIDESGLTIVGLLFNDAGQVRETSGGTFVSYTDVDFLSYDMASTEPSPAHYMITLPTGLPDGRYRIDWYNTDGLERVAFTYVEIMGDIEVTTSLLRGDIAELMSALLAFESDTASALASLTTTVNTAAGTIATNLNATVSSRSTYAGADTPGTATLLTRVTAAVATASALATVDGKIDALPSGAAIETIVGETPVTLAADGLDAVQVNGRDLTLILREYWGPLTGNVTTNEDTGAEEFKDWDDELLFSSVLDADAGTRTSTFPD